MSNPDPQALPARWPSLARGLALVLLFIASFQATATLLRQAVPRDPASVYAAKLDWLQDHADAYDIVFVGNSMVYRHVMPEVFDARMAELGHPVRSFNLGAKGMNVGEVHLTLRRLAALHPAQLQLVVLNLGQRWTPATDNLGTPREIAWHEPTEAALMIRYALSDTAPLADRLERVSAHWEGAFSLLTNRGLFGPRIRALLGGDVRAPTPYEVTRDGYRAFQDEDRADRLAERRHEPFAADPAAYAAALAAISAPGCGLVPFAPHQERVVRSIRDEVVAMGARPVWFLPPMVRCGFGWFADPPPDPVFQYDPAHTPELFRFELRYDRDHLQEHGARAFSRRLADDVAAWLEAR